LDKDGNFTYVNEAMAMILGYSKEEMIGMGINQILHKEHLVTFGSRRDELIKKGKLTFEAIFVTKDGIGIYGENNVIAVYDDDGRFAGARCIFRDITDRKKAEKALKESEEKFRTFMESASDLMFIGDKDGNVTYVNDSMARALGYSKEEMIGMDFTKIVSKGDFEKFAKRKRKLITEGENTFEPTWITSDGKEVNGENKIVTVYDDGGMKLTFEDIWITKDGREVNGENKLVAVYDDDGKFAGVRATFRDITERKQAEKALQKTLHDLGERVKEVNCLYGISKLAEKQDISFGEVIQGIVNLIPSGLEYPESKCARIILEDQEYKTQNLRETIWKEARNIMVDGKKVGSLAVFSLKEKLEKDDEPFLMEEKILINVIAEQSGRIIEHNRAIEKIKTLSITDALTGSYNRLYLNEYLSKEVKKAMRYKHPLSIVMSDIDDFKIINDTYGHQVGDQVLKGFVQYIKESIREGSDWVARYGGEEFLIVLPDTEFKATTTMIERLRRGLPQKISEIIGKEKHITASFGITGLRPTPSYEGISAEVMINQADKYLYQSKREGKNKVIAGQL
jgi:diguanylate cyclase (GGDEF)-like protein/PAS domain S-box-containing protein